MMMMRMTRVGMSAAAVLLCAGASSVAQADWEEANFQAVDQAGAVGAHPDLQFGTIAETAEKRHVLAYAEVVWGFIKVAHRQTQLGQPLSSAPWTIDLVDWPVGSIHRFHSPDVAIDRATGRAYVAYLGVEANGTRSWLATEVQPGTGNCGSGSWMCEDVHTACGIPSFTRVGGTWADWGPQIVLEGEASDQADEAHVLMIDFGGQAWHASKDLATNTWSCGPLAGPGGNSARSQLEAIAQRHELHDRFKPTVTYNTERDQYVLRSLREYSPRVPPWSTPHDIYPTYFVNAPATPSLALSDEGLDIGFGQTGTPTGFGQPAVVVQPSAEVRGMEIHCNGSSQDELTYYLADDSTGSNWPGVATAYVGDACAPSLTFGWNRAPYIAFQDEDTGETMITTQEIIMFFPLFVPAQPIAVGINPSIAFDHDDGTIAVALYDNVAEDLVVVDGDWAP